MAIQEKAVFSTAAEMFTHFMHAVEKAQIGASPLKSRKAVCERLAELSDGTSFHTILKFAQGRRDNPSINTLDDMMQALARLEVELEEAKAEAENGA